jgi:hypothetical protein
MSGCIRFLSGVNEAIDPVLLQHWPSSSPSPQSRFVMSALEEYTIVINDQRFTLLKDQIMRDAPNYFTAFFEGPFKETSEGVREMKLYRDAYLFKFVHLYLSGYDILPLPNDHIPHYFSEESRLKNLLLDARFYGLDTLAEELEAVVPQTERSGNSEERQDGEMEQGRWKVLFVSMLTPHAALSILIDLMIAHGIPKINAGPMR